MLTDAHLWYAAYDALCAQHYGLMEMRKPKLNALFDELQHWVTRFVRPVAGEKWRCGQCGKLRGRKWFWTQLVPFRAFVEDDLKAFTLKFGPMLEALTPVCADHILETWGLGQEEEEEES